jgi:hypothetical protein
MYIPAANLNALWVCNQLNVINKGISMSIFSLIGSIFKRRRSAYWDFKRHSTSIPKVASDSYFSNEGTGRQYV